MSKLSVAMATFNGAAYLPQQLQSFCSQTRRIDELVICDDGSSDDTIRIVEDFSRDAPFPVVLERNAANLGIIRNFEKALSLCTGDILFLSDQDDVWRSDKAELMAGRFEVDPNLALLFSDADLVDQDGARLQRRLWDAFGFSPSAQAKMHSPGRFELLLNSSLVTGATVAIRSSYLPLAAPFPTDLPLFLHDRWLATMITAVARIDFIAEPLIEYRQHPQQQLGVRGHGLGKRLRARLQMQVSQLEQSRKALDEIVSHAARASMELHPDARAILQAYKGHLDARAELPVRRTKRITPVVRELRSGGYGRYSNGVVSALKDLIR